MKALIVAATEMEIKPTLDFLADNQSLASKFKTLITGVGLLNAGVNLAHHLSENHGFDLIINAGIAGSYDQSFLLGTCLEVTKDRVIDIGLEASDNIAVTLEDAGFGHSDNDGWWSSTAEFGSDLGLPRCIAVTRALATKKQTSKQFIQEKYPEATLESMEGAAFFQVANTYGIQVLQIRSVSNYVGELDIANWDFEKSISKLNQSVIALLSQLS